MTARLIAALAATALLAACSKSEAPAPAAAPAPALAAPAQQAQAAPQPTQPDQALLERLARQEAAEKLFDGPKREPKPDPKPEPRPEPKPAAKAEPAPPPAKAAAAPAPTKAAPAPAKAAPAQTPAVAPAKAEAAPAKAEAAAASAPVAVAKAPAAATAAQPSRLVTRVDPEFPSEAVRAGYDKGVVKVRLSVDASGAVTKVDILESRPRRVFDRAVTHALSQWKFTPGAAGRSIETEVDFRQ